LNERYIREYDMEAWYLVPPFGDVENTKMRDSKSLEHVSVIQCCVEDQIRSYLDIHHMTD